MTLQTHKSKVYIRCYHGRWMARIFRTTEDGKLLGIYSHGYTFAECLRAMEVKLMQLMVPGMVVPSYEETFWRAKK